MITYKLKETLAKRMSASVSFKDLSGLYTTPA